MEIQPGIHIIQCAVGDRPLYLPLLIGKHSAALIDCGTLSHASQEIPDYFKEIGLNPEFLQWVIITHPDFDHCGGIGEIVRRFPNVRIACGHEDIQFVESPEFLCRHRYDSMREEHGIFYDAGTAQGIRDACSNPCRVDLTLCGGEMLRLDKEHEFEIWKLPGHSHGHLAVRDPKTETLFYGDAIQGAGYKTIDGDWALCPTYLYVDEYLQSVEYIQGASVQRLVGCHWPILNGKKEVLEFCKESRDFVETAEAIILDHLAANRDGLTLRDRCLELGPKMGSWPRHTHIELAYAFRGHLERAIERQLVIVDRSRRPVTYQFPKTLV